MPGAAVVDRLRKGREPFEIRIRLGRIAHARLRFEEVGYVAIGAGQLAEDIGREPAEAVAIGEPLGTGDGARQLIGDDLIVERGGRREAAGAECPQVRQLRLGPRKILGLSGGGLVVELALQRNAGTRVETEPGRLFGRRIEPRVEEPIEHRPERRIAIPRCCDGLGRQHSDGRCRRCARKKITTMHAYSPVKFCRAYRLAPRMAIHSARRGARCLADIVIAGRSDRIYSPGW